MPSGVYKHKPMTDNQKKKLSNIAKKRGYKPPLIRKGIKFTIEHRKNLSLSHKGNLSGMKGKYHTKETKKNIGLALRGKHLGVKSGQWKGGITPIAIKVRGSLQYKQWQQQVFLRDNFTCQKCGQRGGDLNAHHKKLFSKLTQEAKKYMPLLDWYSACMVYTPLWDLNNGETQCIKCHNKTKMKEGKII